MEILKGRVTFSGEGPTEYLFTPNKKYPVGTEDQTVHSLGIYFKKTATITDLSIEITGPIEHVSATFGEGHNAHSEVHKTNQLYILCVLNALNKFYHELYLTYLT